MGLLVIDYVLYGFINFLLLVVIDINKLKFSYVCCYYFFELQMLIYYFDGYEVSCDMLLVFSGGYGFDDIFVFVLNEQLIILVFLLLVLDGCLNFFVGFQDK